MALHRGNNISSNTLHNLAHDLQESLETLLELDGLIHIKCASRQDILLILVQHLSDISLDAHPIVETLESLIRTYIQTQLIDDSLHFEWFQTVRLYIQRREQTYPYRSHCFDVEAQPTVVPNHPSGARETPHLLVPDTKQSGHDIPSTAIALPVPEPTLESNLDRQSPNPDTEPSEPAIDVSESAQINQSAASTRSLSSDQESLSSQVQMPQVRSSSAYSAVNNTPIVRRLLPFNQLPSATSLAIATVGLIGLVGGIYALTRPCVVGECEVLHVSQTLTLESEKMMQDPESAEQVIKAYDRLLEANYRLSKIPFWSEHHERAQRLLQSYEVDANYLGYVVTAQKHALSAAELSQDPPHPLATWKEVRTLWLQAIDQLKNVPEHAAAYSFAQSKRAEYRANLATINRRIELEEQAHKTISTTRNAAQMAEARESSADSVETWRLVNATWQVVLNRINDVPPDTMAYAEAQQLRAIYEPRLATAHARWTQSEASATSYNRALTFAEQAISFEQNNQWSSAVTAWQNALETVRQIPTDTSYYDQAQPLMNSYSGALDRAQQNLSLAVAIQDAQVDLDRICNATPQICDYTLDSEAIQIYITAEFDQIVEQAIMTSNAATVSGRTQDTSLKINTLLQTLAAIGENAYVSIELYDADGALFATYAPSLSGYTPQD
ncbi:MAG TPA: hypothetical protein ACFE0H_05375 [Elainellaceae cyanobacterium]